VFRNKHCTSFGNNSTGRLSAPAWVSAFLAFSVVIGNGCKEKQVANITPSPPEVDVTQVVPQDVRTSMYKLGSMAALTLAVAGAQSLGLSIGDARRGEQLFETQQCSRCHGVKRYGGTIAPDLARRIDRDYTPTTMATLMWNHAPDMGSAMKKYGVPTE
jgi:hypothetical protein